MEGAKFRAQIQPPQKLNISEESALQTNWRKFARAWKNYEIASNLINETSQFRCAVLLTVIGEDAMDKFDGFKFDAREQENYIETVMRKLEEFCMGTTHEAFESYRFHSRSQELNETIDAYVAELRKLARGCNFENFEDRMIRDRILVGCKSEHAREKLLEDPELTLKRAVEIARAYEASQVKLTEMRDLAIDRVKANSKKKANPEERSKNWPKTLYVTLDTGLSLLGQSQGVPHMRGE